MIKRVIEQTIEKKFFKGKAILIMGARQVGKTFFLKKHFAGQQEVLWLNADDIDVQELFSVVTSTRLRSIIGNHKVVVIDEAQRIQDIGLRMKLITDNFPEVQLIATGSSAFELANKVNEPLTGRKWEYKMFPVSFDEMVKHHGLLEEKRLLRHRLVYGYYPEIITSAGEEEERLRLLADSYLYKDIFLWESIQKPDKLMKLVRALAYQIGSQVSFNELGQISGLDSKTVEKYILLLEQSYVIFRLSSFSRNLRNELKSSKKFYFYDNGIRNAVINSFLPVEARTDIGALWENFLMAERIKFNHYNQRRVNMWFWRTKDGSEIDYLEEQNQEISAYEFKWNVKAKTRKHSSFTQTYNSTIEVINQENFEEFLL